MFYRCAVLVDAGYLYSSCVQLLTAQHGPRSLISIDYDRVLPRIMDHAAAMSGAPLLRIYWYDGSSTGPTPAHAALAWRDHIKLRLGFVSAEGKQRGVDSLIIQDMVQLATNRACSDLVLLTGDEDLRVGVVLAQQQGVRVHLLGIAPGDLQTGNQSTLLQQEADTRRVWALDDVRGFAEIRETQSGSAQATEGHFNGNDDHASAGGNPIALLMQDIVIVALATVGEDEKQEVQSSTQPLLPSTLDRRLLAIARTKLRRDASEPEKRALRTQLRRAITAATAEVEPS